MLQIQQIMRLTLRLKAVFLVGSRRSPKDVDSDKHQVYVLIQKKSQAYIATGIRLKSKEFDSKLGVVIKHRLSAHYNEVIQNIMDQIELIYFEDRHADAKELKKLYIKKQSEAFEKRKDMQFKTFAQKYANLKQGRDRAALDSFNIIVQEFDDQIRLDDWTLIKMEEFVQFLRTKPGRKPGTTYSKNTISKKLEYLKRILNFAQSNEYILSTQNPFEKGYKIPSSSSRDIKLDADQMRLMRENFGDNMYTRAFLLSYYLCGMRFSDLARLRWENFDLERLRLRYTMQKTGKHLELLVTSKVTGLLTMIREDHPSKDGYIFPWLDGKDPKNVRSSDVANALANKHLKVVGAKIGEPELTFHVARHTFSYLSSPFLGAKGAQQLLNHASLDQTSGYIGRLKDSELDPIIEQFHELF